MRKCFVSVVIALGLTAWPSVAQAQLAIPKEGLKFRVDYDAAEMADLCRPGEEGSQQELKNLLCSGYVIGVRDALNYSTDTVRNFAPQTAAATDAFCPGKGVQRGAYIDAFNEYMKLNPAMGKGPAAGVIVLAFEWKFPCSQKAK